MHTDVLLIEDEAELAGAIVDYLTAFGLSCRHVTTAEDGLEALEQGPVGVIVLDVNLPGMNGFGFCRAVRNTMSVPILVVSARSSEDDQILALSIGADDYVSKPFSLAVLLARVRRALDRNRAAPAPTLFDDGRLRVDTASGRTWVDGREVHLTATEDRLLTHLVRRRGSVVTKQDLIEAAWGDSFTSDGTLAVHIRRLRSRIEADPNNPELIRTVWGRGYLFEAAENPA